MSGSDEVNRLVDDAFANICNAMNDVSMRVRAIAAGLLVNYNIYHTSAMCTNYRKNNPYQIIRYKE